MQTLDNVKRLSPIRRFKYWIKERHRIYQRRFYAEKPRPWTEDPILHQYSFCNVYRELDRVTIWISTNWRDPNRDDPNLWFNMLLARLINWPQTLRAIGYPERDWYEKTESTFKMMTEFNERQKRKKDHVKIWSGAYIVSTNGRKMDKPTYILDCVLKPARQMASKLHPNNFRTLQSYCKALMGLNGVHGFIAGQVIADIKYTQLTDAEDWWTFAISGPGSKQGLNILLGNDRKARWKESKWKEEFDQLKLEMDEWFKKHKLPKIHGQDLQNCLCEFQKYEKALWGTGRPRSQYKQVDYLKEGKP